MTRWYVTFAAAAGLAGWAGAEGPADPAGRARQFHRNRPLIQQMVDGGLDLSAESSPLKRAERCNRLAAQLADEVRQAVRDRDPARAAELTGHLRDLIDRGVAANLSAARLVVKVGSQDEVLLERVRDHAGQLLDQNTELLPHCGMPPPVLRQNEAANEKAKTGVRKAGGGEVRSVEFGARGRE